MASDAITQCHSCHDCGRSFACSPVHCIHLSIVVERIELCRCYLLSVSSMMMMTTIGIAMALVMFVGNKMLMTTMVMTMTMMTKMMMMIIQVCIDEDGRRKASK
ncbi:unnamed protein product [Cercopithifilaria johnstoni]|uniref:Uncharacterized protein n=1 Tax=Cercopithifilaria johnstoni TaxID=2874296 RepID=A0A8J2MDH4_9BILA|nr:unnamed protein product [Cercopithifilaria johnstoni]